MNYTETEEIKNEALGQNKWTLYSASDESNSKKKKNQIIIFLKNYAKLKANVSSQD